MPEVVSSDDMDKLLKERDQIGEEVKERLQKNPDPQIYELWKRHMANEDQIESLFEKSVEKSLDAKNARSKNELEKLKLKKTLTRGDERLKRFYEDNIKRNTEFVKDILKD